MKIKMTTKKMFYLLSLLCIILLVAACSPQREIREAADEGMVARTFEAADEEDIKVTATGIKYLVHPDKILAGGPPKDGIPAIDAPKFVSLAEADAWIADDELVLALIYNGSKRVYPLQILVWHEIVNDDFSGESIVITYCPLCGSGIAYKGYVLIDGQEIKTTFGTSGKLYNSNLVMYDRATDTYWTQINGKAIVGNLTGQELEEISIDTVVWRDWKKEHLDSLVLSQATGHIRPYGRDPYGNYYENSFLFFPVDAEDDRLHLKDIIFGIEVDGVYKAYREIDLKETGMIEDIVAGVPIRVERDAAGIVTIINTKTGEEIIKERDMWFAWYAFHPETELYEPNI